MADLLFSQRAKLAVAPKVLGWGDSQTECVTWPTVGAGVRWYSWVNCGKSGFATRAYLDYIRGPAAGTDWGPKDQIAGVVINLGANDYWTPRASPDYAALLADLCALVGEARKLGVGRVALCAPLALEAGYPLTADAAQRVVEITRVRNAIINAASTCGTALIDIGGRLRGADLLALPGLTQDGVHYNALGSKLAADMIGERLAATFF